MIAESGVDAGIAGQVERTKIDTPTPSTSPTEAPIAVSVTASTRSR